MIHSVTLTINNRNITISRKQIDFFIGFKDEIGLCADCTRFKDVGINSFIMTMRALKKRGLLIFDLETENLPLFKLTTDGEIVRDYFKKNYNFWSSII